MAQATQCDHCGNVVEHSAQEMYTLFCTRYRLSLYIKKPSGFDLCTDCIEAELDNLKKIVRRQHTGEGVQLCFPFE